MAMMPMEFEDTGLAYSTTGLTYTNCSRVSGGYCKIQNLVIIAMRITASGTAPQISGFPTYTNKTVSGKNMIATCAPNMSTNAVNNFVALTAGGVLTIQNASSSTDYVVNLMYLCD